MFWDFYPWSERGNDPEPRIREELTERARVRLAHIMTQVDGDYIMKGYSEMLDYTGRQVGINLSTRSKAEMSQRAFIKDSSNEIDDILIYLEYVLNIYLSEERKHGKKVAILHKIGRTFEDEGILVQVKPSAQEVNQMDSYYPHRDFLLQFQQVADETIIETDQVVRTLALGDTWKDTLEPYNKAWQMYKDGTHTSDLIEKLYNSLELTSEKICTDLNDWEDPGEGVGRYLHVLKDEGIFNESPQMNEEASHIAKSLEVTIHRMGGDRKRHIDINSDYCIFMLHQTSAYLSFMIKRYEEMEL